MKILETALRGVCLIEPEIYGDNRGYFLETFQAAKYKSAGMICESFQDNLSVSKKGVLRGLHLQHPGAQGKLVMALKGTVLDVAVDVREGSPTFAKHVAVTLDDQVFRQLWIPRGFAHGFLVLSDDARFLYKCDAPYRRDSELSIRWNDPDLAIDWGIEAPILSPRDADAAFVAQLGGRLPKYNG